MPRRRFSESLVNRDSKGRFAEKAGGRAPALRLREGKNAARRLASSKKLKATIEARNHERFIEREERAGRGAGEAANASRRKLDKARERISKHTSEIASERAKNASAKKALAKKAPSGRGIVGFDKLSPSDDMKRLVKGQKDGKLRPQNKRQRLKSKAEGLREDFKRTGNQDSLKKAFRTERQRSATSTPKRRVPFPGEHGGNQRADRQESRRNQQRTNGLPPARMSPGQERQWNVRLQYEVRTAGGMASRTSPVTEPDDYLYIGGERVDLQIGDYVVDFGKFPSNPDKLAKKFEDIGYDVKRDDRERRWVLKRKPTDARRRSQSAKTSGGNTQRKLAANEVEVNGYVVTRAQASRFGDKLHALDLKYGQRGRNSQEYLREKNAITEKYLYEPARKRQRK